MDVDTARTPAARAIAGWLVASAAASVAVVMSAHLQPESPLGVPGWWSWLLTGAQLVALTAAGTGRGWGWIIGAAVQPPWIAYAVMSGQLGFIPGCAVSAAIQTASFVRHRTRPPHEPQPAAAPPQSMGGVPAWGTRVPTRGSTHARVRFGVHDVGHRRTRSAT